LHAYAVELPAIALQAEIELGSNYGVREVVLALDPDEARALNESRQAEIALRSVALGGSNAELTEMVVTLESLLEQARTQGVEE
jgi:hypothetical protein